MVKKAGSKTIDEKLTEEDALAQAKANGIEFVDSFILFDKDLNMISTPELKTEAKANKWAKDNKLKHYSIGQSRRVKTEGDK